MRFLLDENISHETARHLSALGHDCATAQDLNLLGVDDERIVAMAAKENRMLITLDADFGEIFYFGAAHKIGIIILRIRDQRIKSVNSVLAHFLATETFKNEVKDSLFIIDENTVRIRKRV